MLVKTCVNCTVQNNKITMLTISARCAENEFIEKGIAIRLRGVNYCSSNLRKSCVAGGGGSAEHEPERQNSELRLDRFSSIWPHFSAEKVDIFRSVVFGDQLLF